MSSDTPPLLPDPQPDQVPAPRYPVVRRFWRILRLLALLSIAIAAIAVVLVARGDPTLHVHMLIATALGIGFTVLIGSGLMTLMFLSSSSGHDGQPTVHLSSDEDRK